MYNARLQKDFLKDLDKVKYKNKSKVRKIALSKGYPVQIQIFLKPWYYHHPNYI